VEIGFGIAVAVFALLVVIGREAGTATFAALMLAYLTAFIAFTVAAEAAAIRAEESLPEPTARRSRAATYRSTATGM
jgi:hypothetical protein